MFKKQKFVSVFLVLLLIFSVAALSGCGGTSPTGEDPGGDSGEENALESESITRIITALNNLNQGS